MNIERVSALSRCRNAGGRRALLLVISAPSGAGKTTLCKRLLAEFKQMRRCVTCTTRPPRTGEVNGRDYIFLSPQEFRRRVAAGFFLEHARVHGHDYGTPRQPVEKALSAGRDLLLAIDVQGAAQIRKLLARRGGATLKRAFVDVFVAPPDMLSLKQRLKKRGQDDRAAVALRLKNAAREMACARDYRYRIVNDRLAEALARLKAIVLAEHCRVFFAEKLLMGISRAKTPSRKGRQYRKKCSPPCGASLALATPKAWALREIVLGCGRRPPWSN